MAQTRSGLSIEDQQYDHHGVGQLTRQLHQLKPSLKSVENLITAISAYDTAQRAYMAEVNQTGAVHVDEIVDSLKALLFPKRQYRQTKISHLNGEAIKLAREAARCAQQAIALSKGGVFGIGANKAHYQSIKRCLQSLGAYVEETIVNTPWQKPVNKERYWLVALKESPEAYLKAQEDVELSQCIDGLNAAKRAFPAVKLSADRSNLADQITQYVMTVNRQQEAFLTLSSACAKQIHAIEAKRQSRSRFINFFVDLFTNEKTKLADHKARAKVYEQIRVDYQRIEARTVALRAVGELNGLQRKLYKQPQLITESELSRLRQLCVLLQADPQFNHQAVLFTRLLKARMIEALKQIHQEGAVQQLTACFRLLNEREVGDIEQLNSVRVDISEAILRQLDAFEDEAQAMKYITSLNRIDEKILKEFNVSLYQAIQDKRQQFESLQLLTQGWARLLDQEVTNGLTTSEVRELVAAVLWLDKPAPTVTGAIVDALSKRSHQRVDHFKHVMKTNLSRLADVIAMDVAKLASDELSPACVAAIKHRLLFTTTANAGYTKELAACRTQMLVALRKTVDSFTDVESFDRFLKALNAVLPQELQEDNEVSAVLTEKKKAFVKAHFKQEQRKLHQEFEDEIKFLQTGDLSLWDNIKKKIKRHDKTALTEENMQYWRREFLERYTARLLSQARVDVLMSRINSDGRPAQAAIYEDYLQSLIAESYQQIAQPLIIDLHALTDLRRQVAFSKLDRIFGLEAGKPVDVKQFMLRYLAMTEYQRYYHDDKTLAQAGRGFVREFHQVAQHNPAFVSQFVAKLPLDALDMLYLSWHTNPDVKMEQIDGVLSLRDDIVGVVDARHDAKIQIPRYLLLNMVLELIVADFDALVRGEEIDIKLLNDRIAFAIPKLSFQVQVENTLNDNSDELRFQLLNQVSEITLPTLKDKYHQRLGKEVGEVAHFNRYGILGNVAACEAFMLDKIKVQLKQQMSELETLKEVDFDSSNEIDAVREIEAALYQLAKQRLLQPEKASTIDDVQRSFEAQRDQYQRTIESKRARLAWLKEWEAYLPILRQLLEDRELGLQPFIVALNEKLFDLLDPPTAEFCKTVRNNGVLSQLLKTDKSFQAACAKLKKDLQDGKKIVDIVREIPESVTRELPAKTADMIRQMQYRFADRFKKLMVTVLDNHHLNHVEDKQTEFVPVPVEHKKQRSTLFGFFKHQEQTPQVLRQAGPRLSVKDRLAKAFEKIESDLVKQMLLQLSSVAERDQISLAHLYNLNRVSEPVSIRSKGW